MTRTNRPLVLGLWVLLGACASGPDALRDAPPGDVQPAAVLRAPESFLGTPVRWGGNVAAIRNLADETTIEIVSRRLDGQGRPLAEDQTDGRFLAKIAGFLDPAVYVVGREVTVSGQVQGATKQAIGEFPYTYPVVRAEKIFLWPARVPLGSYPYYYDPLWPSPFYPFGWPVWRPLRPW